MQGATPLYTAAEYNRPDIAKLLIKHGGVFCKYLAGLSLTAVGDDGGHARAARG